MQLCTARDAQGADRPRFFAGVNACCLWRDMHVMCICSGVHRGAVFKFQRGKALFG